MIDTFDDDALFGRLNRLVAAAKRTGRDDRRLVLALQSDLRTLQAALQKRSDALAQKLNMADARSSAMSAYSRIAFLGRRSPPAPTNR